MKRIVFIVNDFSFTGGVARVTSLLANKFSERYHVQVISIYNCSDRLPFPLNAGIKHQTLYSRRISIYELKDYKKLMLKGRVVTLWRHLMYLAYLIINKKKARARMAQFLEETDVLVVPQIYGLEFVDVEDKRRELKIIAQTHLSFDEISQNKLYMKLLKKYQPWIDMLAVLTKSDRDKYLQESFSQAACIYNPLTFRSEKTSVLSSGSIIFIGRLTHQKGVDLLPEIGERLREIKARFTIDVYGEGYLLDEVQRKLRNRNLENHVRLRGVSSEMHEALLGSSLLIMPSRYEGLPLVMLEAMECGVPVVSFRSFDGIDEIIQEAKNGFVVESGNVEAFVERINHYLEMSLPDRETMGKHAKKIAGQFDIDVVFERWQTVIEDREADH